jgi:hypothetical protein
MAANVASSVAADLDHAISFNDAVAPSDGGLLGAGAADVFAGWVFSAGDLDVWTVAIGCPSGRSSTGGAGDCGGCSEEGAGTACVGSGAIEELRTGDGCSTAGDAGVLLGRIGTIGWPSSCSLTGCTEVVLDVFCTTALDVLDVFETGMTGGGVCLL